MRQYCLAGVVVLGVVVLAFLFLIPASPVSGSGDMGMTLYNDGQEIDNPYTYAWKLKDGGEITDFDVTLTFTVTLDSVELSTVQVTGSMKIIVKGTGDTEHSDGITYETNSIDVAEDDSWTKTWAAYSIETVLQGAYREDIQAYDEFTITASASLTATGTTDRGESVESTWSDSCYIVVQYSGGTITLDASLGI